MLNLKSIETFYWVATLNSFRGAASKLQTTQSVVSQKVANLEGELGGMLFERTSRTVRLTLRGRTLYDYAKRFMTLESELIEAMAPKEGLAGRIRLGVFEAIVHTWLHKFIELVHERHPALSVDIVVDDPAVLQTSLAAGDLDLVFMPDRSVVRPELIVEPLCRYPVRFIASPRLISGVQTLTPDLLAGFPILSLPAQAYSSTTLRKTLATGRHPEPRFFINYSISAIAKMAVDELGIALLPTAMVESELTSGALQEMDATIQLDDLILCAIYPRQAHTPACATLTTIAMKASAF